MDASRKWLIEQHRNNGVSFPEMMTEELQRGREKFPAGMHSPHEAYGVIAEELAEFFDLMRQWDGGDIHPNLAQLMLRELVQTAAMCQRAAEDLELHAS